MREIKFRAWDGSRIRYDITGFEHGEGNRMEGVFIDGDYYDMKETPVMQYTGLKDENGTDIYEGDVVGGIWDSPIKWCDVCLCFQVYLYGECGQCSGDVHWAEFVGANKNSIEVIGNIYENPDLLNEPVRNSNELD